MPRGRPRTQPATCDASPCERACHARGLCKRHATMAQRRGLSLAELQADARKQAHKLRRGLDALVPDPAVFERAVLHHLQRPGPSVEQHGAAEARWWSHSDLRRAVLDIHFTDVSWIIPYNEVIKRLVDDEIVERNWKKYYRAIWLTEFGMTKATQEQRQAWFQQMDDTGWSTYWDCTRSEADLISRFLRSSKKMDGDTASSLDWFISQPDGSVSRYLRDLEWHERT